jgi:TPR repeat protein
MIALGLVVLVNSAWSADHTTATFNTMRLAQTDGATRPLGKPVTRRQPIYRSVPYLARAVSPAAAAAMRAVRQYEPRIVREDLGQVVAHDKRYVRAAVRAVARYQRAADQGYVMARYNLARALAEGRGVKRDYTKAIESFRLAALLGNVPALLRLAEFYLAGLGVPADRVEAQAIYYVAASIESKGAARAKALLSTHLDNNQIQQARKRARKLRAEMPALDLILQRSKERNLLTAAAQGDLKMIQTLLKSGVDANAINALGRTPAIAAAWRGHHDIVALLINSGVEIDAADNQGRTALTWAAINGYPRIVDRLLAADALVDVRDDKGLTPLIRAAWNGHEKVVGALIDAEADVHAADDRGITALQRATSQNELKIIARLRSAGAQ